MRSEGDAADAQEAQILAALNLTRQSVTHGLVVGAASLAGSLAPEDDPKPWVIGDLDEFWLQVGWLVLLGVSAILAALLSVCWPYPKFDDVGTGVSLLRYADAGRLASTWYDILWGGSPWSVPFNVTFITVSLSNFVCFALGTEIDMPEAEQLVPFHRWAVASSSSIARASRYVETGSVCFFILVILLRLTAAAAHPVHGRFGHRAWWSYFKSSVFTQVELVCLLPSIINVLHQPPLAPNLMWLCWLRTVEIMRRTQTSGTVLRKIKKIVSDQGTVISIFFGFGGVLWLFFSALYFLANYNNDDARWEAVEYKGKGWQRFESVPSSMFFVLINLSKEDPLADVHNTVASRLLVMSVCLVGVPLFALPAGLIGSAMEKQARGTMGAIQEAEGSARVEVQEQNVDSSARGTCLEVCFPRPWMLPVVTAALSLACVVCCFYYTAGHVRLLGVWVNVTPTFLAAVDGLVALFFVVEWVFRIGGGQPGYLFSVFQAIDLLAWAPGAAHAALVVLDVSAGAGGGCATMRYADAVQTTSEGWMGCGYMDWLRAACVLRMLKMERYTHAFGEMLRILYMEGPILKVTGFMTFIMWVTFSTLLYYTERHNPDGDLRENYGSIPRALWAEAINLHGEWVWCDYTAAGKCIGAVIMLASSGIFMVPITVFSNGYQSKLEDLDARELSEAPPWQARLYPASGGWSGRCFEALYAHLRGGSVHERRRLVPPNVHAWYKRIRRASLLLTCLSAFATVLLTVESFDAARCGSAQCHAISLVLYSVDLGCLFFFTLELSLRLIALGPCYLLSFVGVCDLLSLLALGASCVPVVRRHSMRAETWALKNNFLVDMIVPARLTRLFCFENYYHPVHLVLSVCRLKRKSLVRSGYALLTVWCSFGFVLYLCERDPVQLAKDDAAEAAAKAAGAGTPDMTMPQRFRDALTALQYALVHLTGDYPITEYCLASRVFHLMSIVFGMCFVAAFTGIFAAGFTQRLKAGRSVERRQAAQRQLTNVVFAVLVLQRKFRQMRARRAAGLEINNNWWPTSTLSREQELAMRQSMRIRSALRSAFKRETLEGRRIMTVTHGALMLNVFCAMFCTIPEVEANWRLMKFFNTVEIVTGYVFVNEYLTRLLVAPRWWREAKKPMRILDLCCLLPVLGVVFQASTAYRWRGEVNMWDHVVDLARVLRVLRILDFTCIREAGKKAFRAVSAALGCLAEPGVLALSVWIFSTSLFAWAEHEYDGRDKDHLKSMPDALYWTSMYIKGEWANVDFSRGAGSRLCIFYCIFGLAAFAVPVGLMIEAVENSVTTYAEEHKELKAFLSKHSSDAVARLVEARQTTSRGHSGCLM